MKKYKVEATMIIRPYLTVEANSKEEAIKKVQQENFSEHELLETGFPASNIEVDEVYEADSDAQQSMFDPQPKSRAYNE